jgi:hypothetical protein
MPARRMLSGGATALLMLMLASCGGDPTETSAARPTAEPPSGPTAPPPVRTAPATNATAPATTTMPPLNATAPRE